MSEKGDMRIKVACCNVLEDSMNPFVSLSRTKMRKT